METRRRPYRQSPAVDTWVRCHDRCCINGHHLVASDGQHRIPLSPEHELPPPGCWAASAHVVLDAWIRDCQSGCVDSHPQPCRPWVRRGVSVLRCIRILRSSTWTTSGLNRNNVPAGNVPGGCPSRPLGVHRPSLTRRANDGPSHNPCRGRHIRPTPADHRSALAARKLQRRRCAQYVACSGWASPRARCVLDLHVRAPWFLRAQRHKDSVHCQRG